MIDDSRVWFFGRMWEDGDDQSPNETCNGPAAEDGVAGLGLTIGYPVNEFAGR